MADDKDLDVDVEENENEAEGNSGKGKLIIIIAIAVLLIGGGAAAFFLMGGEEETPTGEEGVKTEEKANEKKEPARYVGVPEAITSNIVGKHKSRTVQIKMSFMVRSDDAVTVVKTHMPRLKNDVLMLVSQQSADELRTPEGRVKLKEQSLATVQKTLNDLVGDPTIEQVLFISFLMQ